MGKQRLEEIDMGNGEHWTDTLGTWCVGMLAAIKPSYWFIVYNLFAAIGLGLVLCARPIYRYWPAITSAFWELFQCVAGLR